MVDPQPEMCRHTLAHLGLKDFDVDGKPDVIDMMPNIRVDSIADTVTTIFPILTGHAGASLHRNWAGDGSRNRITFNSISDVIYRIDNRMDALGFEEWLTADAGGPWDDTAASFSFAPDSLTAGPHTISVRAVNSARNVTDLNNQAQVHIYVKAIAVQDLLAEPDYNGTVKIGFRVRGGTLGADARLLRIVGNTETEIASFPLVEDQEETFYDSEPAPGVPVTYRLEASVDDVSWDWETSIVAPSPIPSGAFLSRVSPNPFRDRTVISYYIPRGDPVEEGIGDGKPDEGEIVPPDGERAPRFSADDDPLYKQVRVDIDIFNAAGRRVRSFPRVHGYEGFHAEPLIWDGTDDSGRALPSGVYLIHMRAGPIQTTRKVVYLK